MKNKKNSISNKVTNFFIIIIILQILILSHFWLSSIYSGYRKDVRWIKENFLQNKKELLKTLVRKTTDEINYTIGNTRTVLKNEIKHRTMLAYEIISHIYQINKDKKTHDEIITIIKEILRPVQWNNGKEHYFAFNTSGVGILSPVRPELESKSVLSLKDYNGKNIIKDAIGIAKTKGESFYVYKWKNYNSNDEYNLKISYIKYFKPLDLIVGTGEYFKDVEDKLKNEIIKRIERIHFGNGGYLFAGTYDGITLSGPAKGKNVYDIEDKNGLKVVQELIKRAKSGGGFVEYIMPEFKGIKSAPKLSYVEGINDWKWYVGAGVYIDEIQSIINNKTQELKKDVRHSIITMLLLLLGSVIIVFYFVYYFKKNLKSNINVFLEFFNKAASDNPSIDVEKIKFQEFEIMAIDAIKMVKARKIAENELTKAKEYLVNLINSMPSAIIGTDKDLNITLINDVAIEFFKISKENIIGKNISDLPILNNYVKELENTLNNKINLVKEKERFEINGRNGFLRLTVCPLQKFSKGLVIRIDDISENVKLENMLIHNEKMMSLGGLAAGMAHEINNPLGIIIQGIQNINRRLDSSFAKNLEVAKKAGINLNKMNNYLKERNILDSLDFIEKAGIRASEIVQNMLEFSRQNANSFDRYDICDMLNNAINLAMYDFDLKKAFKFKNVSIVKTFKSEIKTINCNKTEIEQVVLNILKNAAQAMSKIDSENYIPEIIIKTYSVENNLFIEIMDNGPGIPETVIGRIFEPFFTTKDLSEGTGLGLSISYFIITNNHKGQISVENRQEGGAKFTIVLPQS